MPRLHRHLPLAAALLGASVLAVLACSHDSTSSTVAPPTSTDSSKSSTGLSIAIDSGISGQTAPVGTAIAVRVHVTQSGAAVPSASVSWTVTAGHGSVAAATSTTDAGGLAQIQWTLGDTAGTNSLTAAIAGAQVEISATGIGGAASSMTKVSPDSQTVVAGATLTLTARVVDRFGNAVGGSSVGWSSSGGVLSSATTVTGPSGNATTNLVTAAAPARYSVTATLPGKASVTFLVIAQ